MATTFPVTARQRSFLLQRAQPAMIGLIDGSLSTLAPVIAVAFATHQPRYAFLAGLATAIGAGTFLGGVLHTLPFLISRYRSAVLVALAAIAFELLALAAIRLRFFGTGFLSSLISVTLAGAIIATISAALGAVS